VLLAKHANNRVSIVASLEVENREFRLDPTRYNERGESIVRHFRLRNIEAQMLGNLPGVNRVFVPARFKRPYVDDKAHGVPFLGSSSMLALRLPTDALLSSSFNHLKGLTLSGGELLLSCSGTIGVSVLCGASYAGFAVSQHAARIFATKDIRGYLHAYLSSDIGRELVLQQNYGKVIKELTEDQIKRVLVPVLPPDQVEEINAQMLEASAKYDVARVALETAERSVLEALAMKTTQAPAGVWLGTQRISFAKAANDLIGSRLDPHFHAPEANHLRHVLLAMPHKTLGSIASLWMPTRFARPDAQKGFGEPFYSSADIMRARRLPGSIVARKAARLLAKCRVSRDTILICRSGAFGGIMGRAAYASAAMDGWAISEHMVRCKVTDQAFIPEYVCAVLASLSVGYPIVTAYRHGKDVPELDPDDLGGFPVPLLPRNQQEKIAASVKLALQAVDEANALEDKAISTLLGYLSYRGA
jgi:type I restriction enzyme S subunit